MGDISQTTQNLLTSNAVDTDAEYRAWRREKLLRRKLDPIIDKLIIEKGRGALWEVVDIILKYLWKYKREYMQALLDEVKHDRDLLHNQFGGSKEGSVRKLGSIPEELEILLNRAYLDEIQANSRQFRREFFKRYPAFRVAEKI